VGALAQPAHAAQVRLPLLSSQSARRAARRARLSSAAVARNYFPPRLTTVDCDVSLSVPATRNNSPEFSK